MRSSIDSQKVAMGFNPDAKLDSLDGGHRKMLDSLQTAYDTPVDSALNARMDSLSLIHIHVVQEVEEESQNQQFVQNNATREDRKAARRKKREQKRQAKNSEAAVLPAEDNENGQ